MQQRILPVFRDIAFNAHPVVEYVPMQPFSPLVFDRFCEDGWTYWSDVLFRRNYWEWRGMPCRVIVLRIRLKDFQFSSSQRKLLRKYEHLTLLRRAIKIEERHIDLFQRHSERFGHNKPQSIFGFFSHYSSIMPCFGLMFEVWQQQNLLATSYFHVGHKALAGNYCIYDSNGGIGSLGTYTMLKEIEFAMQTDREFYYPGFVYDLPSEFDYKLNFNNLEYFDWSGSWYPLERLPVRDWRSEGYETLDF
jgi:leucyl-tRNA---protein transferase